MPHQHGNPHNLRRAMRASARERTCRHCTRGGALGRWYHPSGVATVSVRECRYCGAAEVLNHDTSTTRYDLTNARSSAPPPPRGRPSRTPRPGAPPDRTPGAHSGA